MVVAGDSIETRVLLVATTARDAELTSTVLAHAGVVAMACRDEDDLGERLTEGAGAVLIAEEAIRRGGSLNAWLAEQPPWSDLPVLVLARSGANSHTVARAVEELGNVTVLERPIRIAALVSAVRTALRARHRQYQLREQFAQREQVAEQLDMAMAAAHAGSWQLNMTTGEFRATARALELHGVPPETPLDNARALACVHPHDRASLDAALQVTLATGQPFRHEHRVVRPDGTVRWVMAHGECRTSNGQRHLIGLVQDITERRETEQALLLNEERLRLALSASQAGAWAWEVPTGAISWSPENFELYGYDPAELTPTYADWVQRIHPEDRAAANAAVTDALAGRVSEFRHEFRVTHPVRGDRWLLGLGQVTFTPEGVPTRMVGINLDISDRLRVEDELRHLAAALSETDRRKDVFLATLAHELRNPLAPISNGLQLMKLRHDGDMREQVRAMMERQLAQLVRLVDDLLDVSRITQGKLELRVERLDLLDVIEAAVEASRPTIELAGHQLSIVTTEACMLVDGDAARLAQVVSNILNNAAKYTPRGGQIRLAISREADTAVIKIDDDGIGIPSGMIDRIFEMFTQVDRTLEKSVGGLGIGLSLARALLEMHGGTIAARSDGAGHGSSFMLRLPAVPMAVRQRNHPDRDSDERVSSRRRILVVDDNVDSAESIAQVLALLGNDVVTAHDGEAGIATAAEVRPDMVFMDIGMPRLNGYEAARRMRAQQWGADLVLVALTGWGDEGARQESARAGFDHHLVKPVDMTMLRRLLDDAARRTRF